MRHEPVIPQQLISVEECVVRVPGGWTGLEMVAGADGVWHRLKSPQERTAVYLTNCGATIMGAEARTALTGETSCSECRR